MIWNYTYVLDQIHWTIRTVNLKSRSPRTFLRRTPAGIKRGNYQNLQHLNLYLQKISTKTAIFTTEKHEKMIMLDT